MRVLITGAGGFVGAHLARTCRAHGADVTGWVREYPSQDFSRSEANNITTDVVDLLDGVAVHEGLEKARPDYIFHLAAKSHIGQSWLNPLDTLQTNISAQVNLLEAVRRLGLESRIAIAGSSEEYGALDPKNVPIDEETPLKPVSPYAVSKVAQDLMGLQYFKNYKMHIVRLRLFNLTGPGRSEAFVTGAFARQVARVEAGFQDPVIHVGNLKVVRDFTDVRDAAEASWMALERGEAGDVYNICSGTGVEIGEILELLRRESTADFKVAADGDRARPSDLPVIIGNGNKFRERTGWVPRISFGRSMKDLLDEWRTRVKSGA
jgi:GDP-4-dehydro-6-deoxy-D-mannose reductase